MTEDLRRNVAWCCTNSLLINPDKRKLLLLGSPQMPGARGLQCYPPWKEVISVTIRKGHGSHN